jgi:serine/threonine protein kinase
MDKMLTFDPNKRITVVEALAHPYFAALHNEEQEIACDTPFDFSFEDVKMDKDKLQELMLEEVYKARPEERAKREEK